VICRNCGRANSDSRSVCFQCGRRLLLSPALRAQRAQGSRGTGSRFLAMLASVLVLVLAVGAGGLILAGALPEGDPQQSASPLAVTSPTAPLPSLPATGPPSIQPAATRSPTPSPPAMPSPTVDSSASPGQGVPTPTPATAGCLRSSTTTAWVNLTRENQRRRPARDQVWCVYEVVVVPYYGFGTIRLLVDGEAVAEVNHARGTDQAEYEVALSPPVMVPPRADIRYQFRCAVANCAAVIQVGHDRLPAP
jgi:hypothetical protein